jgi:esterase/lipase superfamily enzyme
MKHIIITNREVIKVQNKERIRTDGREEAGDEIRFAIFDSARFHNKMKDAALHTCLEVLPDMLTPAPKPAVHMAAEAITLSENVYAPNILTQSEKTLAGSSRVFAQLYHQMSSDTGGDVLLFIHGFNTDLKTLLSNLKELEDKYLTEDSPIKHLVAFTWPAMSKLLRYRNDARDAELSGFALGRTYNMLIDFFRTIFGPNPHKPRHAPCGNHIHLMCHSMGNRVLENMMLMLTQGQQQVTSLFKEVILMSSDIDWNCFEEPRPLYRLTEICERVHIYYHKNDAALFISETTKNAFNRLGKYGPRDTRRLPSHIYCVDCTSVKDQKGLKSRAVNHWFYVDSAIVIQDVKHVLSGLGSEAFKEMRHYIHPAQYRLG